MLLDFYSPTKTKNVAKSRTEILTSIKERLENFKNNPLLNPDFSNTVDDAPSPITVVFEETIDDIESVLDAMNEHTGIKELVEFNDRLEQEMFDAHEAMYADSKEMPSELYQQTGIDGDELPLLGPTEE